jgi:hypothetical protein
MYSKVKNEKKMIEKAIEFMSDTDLFSKSMGYVVYNWVHTMDNSLTNKYINRIAFIGQCACFHSIGCPEYLTKKSWKYLDNTKQILANIEADEHLKLWTLRKYMSISKSGKTDVTKMDYQMKLQLS